MRVGVLGTGMVGDAIASKLIALGHEVMMGSSEQRRPYPMPIEYALIYLTI